MSESLALPSAGSQLLRHPQPHTRTCAHAHAHGAVTRARSHARPPCPSSPSPPRLQAAMRALHCGSCLQVGGASAPPPRPPRIPLLLWLAGPHGAGTPRPSARAAPSLGAPGPGPQKGPAGRSSPPAFQAGAVLKQEWAWRQGKVWAPHLPWGPPGRRVGQGAPPPSPRSGPTHGDSAASCHGHTVERGTIFREQRAGPTEDVFASRAHDPAAAPVPKKPGSPRPRREGRGHLPACPPRP